MRKVLTLHSQRGNVNAHRPTQERPKSRNDARERAREPENQIEDGGEGG